MFMKSLISSNVREMFLSFLQGTFFLSFLCIVPYICVDCVNETNVIVVLTLIFKQNVGN